MQNISAPPYPGPPVGLQYPNAVHQRAFVNQQQVYMHPVSAQGAPNANVQYSTNPNYPEHTKQGPPGQPLSLQHPSCVQQGGFPQLSLQKQQAVVESSCSSEKGSIVTTQTVQYSNVSLENTSSPSYAPQQCGYPPPPPYSPPTFQSPNYTQQIAAGLVQQNVAVQPTPQPAVIQQPAQPAVIQAPNAAMMLGAGVSSPVIQSAAQPPLMLQQQVIMQPGGQPTVVQPLGAIQPMVQPRIIYQAPAANAVVYQQLF
ncbi:hypothetical protein SRHO_G00181090 [Serrasalmus rhombeus]